MMDNFYRAFEDKHRGSRELIKERLTAYAPFLKGILSLSEQPEAIDFGCGRGEWLEYIQSLDFKAQGVDLDENMLEACERLDLSVKKGEMIEFIRTVPDESCLLVSAFHVVEHISFDDLKTFTKEALRVLQPGGLLIMETPNPENIIVATRNFYLDPTHQKPIPPDLLNFVSEHAGFSRSKIVRLQEPPELRQKPEVTLIDVFAGASPDYSIVAQKQTTAKAMAKFDSAFEQNYGLSLDNLLGRWETHFNSVEQKLHQVETKAEKSEKAYTRGVEDGVLQTQLAEAQRLALRNEQMNEKLEAERRELWEQLTEAKSKLTRDNAALKQKEERLAYSEEKISELEQEIVKLSRKQTTSENEKKALEDKLRDLEEKLVEQDIELESKGSELEEAQKQSQWLQNEWNAAKAKNQELNGSSHHWWTVANHLNQTLQSIYQSKFWLLTWPLRKAMQGFRSIFQFLASIIRLPKRAARWFLEKSMAYILQRKQLKYRARQFLYRHPKLECHLRAFARRRGLISGYMPSPQYEEESRAQAGGDHRNAHVETGYSISNTDFNSTLTPRARRLYAELNLAIEKKQGSKS